MPLQKPFRGFSDLMGEFSLGELNFELPNSIQPSVDMLKFASEPEWHRQVTGPSTFSSGSNPGVTIPNDEIWILWHIGGVTTAGLPANQTISTVPIYEISQTDFIPLSNAFKWGSLGSTTAGQFDQFSASFPNGLWLRGGPGNQLGFLVTWRVGNDTFTYRWAYQISKFKV